MRLIDADALANKLIEIGNRNGEYEFITQTLLWHLDRAPTVSKWVPVTEKLPEDGQEVLITVEKEVEVFAGYSERRTVWHAMMHDEEEKHFCIWGDEQHLFSEVIAWMPLPEPYKEVTDNWDAEKEGTANES